MIWLVLAALAIPAALVLLVVYAGRPTTAAVRRRRHRVFFVVSVILGLAQIAIGLVELWNPPVNRTNSPSWLYYSTAVWFILSGVLFLVLFRRQYRQQRREDSGSDRR